MEIRIRKQFERIGITADPHGDYEQMFYDAERNGFDEASLTIILGDTGLNYDNGLNDISARNALRNYPGTILCIRGNHDRSVNDPDSKRKFIPVNSYGGTLWYEKDQEAWTDMPLILYAEGIQQLHINDHSFLCIPGAYTPDRQFRINTGLPVFADEQLSYEEMEKAYEWISQMKADIILSHTCPLRFLYCLYPSYQLHLQDEQSLMTERFLQRIEDSIQFNEWYCGHHHMNLDDCHIHFLFRSVRIL